jgi:hypothetical protein
MGQRGPVPKRSSERMGHRTKAQRAATEKVALDAPLVAQPPADSAWHPVAHDWYVALAASGQAVYFEPSDWAAARYLAGVMTENLAASRFSAQLFSSVWTAMNDLMTTEASRRRLHLELERESIKGQSRSTIAIADYRAKLAA